MNLNNYCFVFRDLIEEKRLKKDNDIDTATFTNTSNLGKCCLYFTVTLYIFYCKLVFIGNGNGSNTPSTFYSTNVEMTYESHTSTPVYSDGNSIQC